MSLPAGCRRVTLRALRMIALGWLLVPGARLCFAQAGGPTATLRGNVADPSDAVVANASVTLTDIGTKTVRAAVTSDRGAFTFAGLFPGSYDARGSVKRLKITSSVWTNRTACETCSAFLSENSSASASTLTTRASC